MDLEASSLLVSTVQDKVIVTECHNDLLHRMTVDGNYASHECGITVTNISVEDAGDWECEVRAATSGKLTQCDFVLTAGGVCSGLVQGN